MEIRKIAIQALIVSLLPVSVNAQKNVSIDWYGFLAAQSWINSHESVAGAEGFLYLYPTDENTVNPADPTDKHDRKAIPQGSWFGTMVDAGNGIGGAMQICACTVGQFAVNGFAAILGSLSPYLIERGQMV